MTLNFVNSSSVSMPKKFLYQWIQVIIPHLPRRDQNRLQGRELTLVFLNTRQAQKINKTYRKKSYATDVLSFSGERELLGELILCPQVIHRQAKENNWKFQNELAYMVLHGLLHLLGYEHETGGIQAKKMLNLQDRIFQACFSLNLKGKKAHRRPRNSLLRTL